MAKDWYLEVFGEDLYAKLIVEGWSGRTAGPAHRHDHQHHHDNGRDIHGDGPARDGDDPLWDRVLHEKTFPDHAIERAFMRSLEDEWRRGERCPRDEPDHGLDR